MMADRHGTREWPSDGPRDTVVSEKLILLICGVVFTLTLAGALWVLFGLHDAYVPWLRSHGPDTGSWQYMTLHAVGFGMAVWGIVQTWRTSTGARRIMYLASELAAIWLLFPELTAFVTRHVTLG